MNIAWRFYSTLDRWYLEAEYMSLVSVMKGADGKYYIGDDSIVPQEILPRDKQFDADHECKAYADEKMKEFAETLLSIVNASIAENEKYHTEIKTQIIKNKRTYQKKKVMGLIRERKRKPKQQVDEIE